MKKKPEQHEHVGRTAFELPKVGPCTRCGAKWTPIKPVVPIRCAKCKSFYWQLPRTRKQTRKKTA